MLKEVGEKWVFHIHFYPVYSVQVSYEPLAGSDQCSLYLAVLAWSYPQEPETPACYWYVAW